jgi:hypothetical protein
MALVHAEATGSADRDRTGAAGQCDGAWRLQRADRLFGSPTRRAADRCAPPCTSAGQVRYDQGRYIGRATTSSALELRKVEDRTRGADRTSLDAVFRKVAENGWGRTRARARRSCTAQAPDPGVRRALPPVGYVDADGTTKIEAGYADVQPFRDGVAWVRRPEYETWELINETGMTLVPASFGLLGVSSYADGLAWVSRDGVGAWMAIDQVGRVAISTGFDDVRPFRRGIAAVRRQGRWGAVDKMGRVVVKFEYEAFPTSLTDGRYIDGFSDEGLCVVEVGGRKGVVDRTGKLLVPPVHPAVVIHPVAFLISDATGRWGALDRAGRPLIDPVHPSRAAVIDEIDRLLADTKPVL